MSGKTNNIRQTRRRQETRAEILDAAWSLVRREGLAGLSMRDLGGAVGMRAQSIYSYFASKQDIYDAMFREGYEAFWRWMDDALGDEAVRSDPVESLRRATHAFFAFCMADPARYQLLFQRTVPGFEPSTESYAVAVTVYDRLRESLLAVGGGDEEAMDLWTAVSTGLTDQQISNDPGGDRWERLIDRAVDMLIAEIAPTPHLTPKEHDR